MAAERRNDGALQPAPKLKRPLDLLTTQASKDMSSALDLDVQRVVAQTAAIQKVMQALMQEGVHYGVVPGTERQGKEPKPSLFQAGADKLCLLFRLRPSYKIRRQQTEDFISIEVRCQLLHIVTGELWGEGMGSCNSREAKYANQSTAKVCPACRKPAIIKGKTEFGGGWVCYQKKDGCGAKFPEDAKEIVNQTGQILSGKAWDLHNTMLKMACKRSKTAAVLTATAASDIFTQDLEDLEPDEAPAPEPPANLAAAQPAAARSTATPAAAVQPQPAASTNGGGRANPTQIRDLNMALAEMGVGVDEAEERKLTGRAREDFIVEERLKWCAGVLGVQVTSMQALSSVDTARLVAAARGR